MKALAAAISASFAIALYASRPKNPAVPYLVAFLALIAANQGAEAARPFFTEASTLVFLERFAAFSGSIDPALLFLFVRARFGSPGAWGPGTWAVVVGGGLLAVASAFVGNPVSAALADRLHGFALAGYTGVVYSTCLVRAARVKTGDASASLLLTGLALAAVPTLVRIVDEGFNLLRTLEAGPASPASQIAQTTTWMIALALLAAFSRTRSAVSMGLAGAIKASILLTVALKLHNVNLLFHYLGALPEFEAFAVLGRSGASIRWLFFGALVSTAVLRHGDLVTSLASRRRAARILLGFAAVVAGLLLLAAVEAAIPGAPIGLSFFEVLLLVGLALVSQGARGLVDRVAQTLYGVPRALTETARLEVYRTAAARREADVVSTEDLERLRDELGLDSETARAIERVAGATLDAPLAVGHLVAGRYLVERFVSRGSEGRVFLARDRELERRVAIKEVPDDAAKSGRTEAIAGGRYAHPNLLTVLDLVKRPGVWLIVTEYAAGGTLGDALDDGRAFTLAESASIVDGLLAALERLHEDGVVHHDVKPANIFLTGTGEVKLGDFGLAGATRAATLPVGGPRGTPSWMAPEVLEGARATPASDLYAAGLVAKALVPSWERTAFAAVLTRALEKAPDERWASARAMRAAWKDAAYGSVAHQ